MAKVFLESMKIPSQSDEFSWLYEYDPAHKASMKDVYSSHYPFSFLTRFFEAPCFRFEPITIFYGGNGSGKSTLLNIIAEMFNLERKSPFNKTDFFDEYCNMCRVSYSSIPKESKIITSDDIFSKMAASRFTNNKINDERAAVKERKITMREQVFDNPELLRFQGMDYYDKWSEYYDIAYKPTSVYLLERAQKNLKSGSNGETAMVYLTEAIKENALYLLDEPENSLAPKLQNDLKTFLEDSARFFNCQFIIATHSPILLSMKGAKIYNLDDDYADPCKWNELENVRIYADLFLKNKDLFI